MTTRSFFLTPAREISLKPFGTTCTRLASCVLLVFGSGLVGAAEGGGALPAGSGAEADRETDLVQVEGAQQAFDTLRTLQARQQWMEEEISRLQGQLSGGKKRVESLNQALREKEVMLSTLQGELDRLKQVNQKAEAARRLLTAENAKFAAALSQERTRADAQQQASSQQVDALQQRVAEKEAEALGLRARFSDLEAMRDQALSANLSLQAEKRALEETLDATQQSVEELVREAESLRATLESRHTEHQVLGRDKDKLEDELSKVQEKATDLERELRAQQSSHAQARAATEAEMVEHRVGKQELQTRLTQAQANLAELEGRLQSHQQTHGETLASVEGVSAKLRGENQALKTELAEAREEVEDLVQRLKVLEDTHSGAVAALERLQKDKADLQSQAEAEQKVVTDLRKRLSEAEAAAGNAESELTALRSQLPAAVGGSVTDEEVRQVAAESLIALRELYRKRGAMEKEAWTQARNKLESELRDQQLLLAQALSATSVYRVRRDDTLAKISKEIYGRAGRWPEIFEANRHVLADPDRLFPGMTLVIP
ncbi:MAG: LysM peptidoglycan-binding domain-containing protein [Pseudomonadota bacterium]|nr:LysM peptidoglycan-binding domain-containing protein [Pseudomonadota bacterium]